jgi:hypothetical protein
MIGFNGKYKQKLRVTTFTITCPYFTIEFTNSADKRGGDVAINQMINSSSITLYNRFRLREKALTIKADGGRKVRRPEDERSN